MTRLIAAALLTAACAIAPGAAIAQGACPDGRTAAGQCINPSLAEFQRQSAVIYSQPKISQTHYPILPALDWIFRYPNQLNPDQNKPSQMGVLPPSP
jgi:hypothetical protein